MLPSLTNINRIALDTETNGLKRHDPKVKVCGISLAHEGGSWYLPFRHAGGGNLDEAQVLRWAKSELRDKVVEFVNPNFDLHMLRKDGIDLEKQGCIPRCVQFKAALLDDNRRKFDLDTMALDFLGKGKFQIDHEKIHEFSGEVVAPYARQDAEITLSLADYFDPKIDSQGLTRVAQLEDTLIYCTLYMEMQGVRLDIPKLKRWRAEVEMELRVQQGLLGDLNVKSGKQLQDTFKKLGIPIYNFTGKGNPCFDEESLKDTIVRSPHPMLQQILNVRWLRGLLEKFESYLEEVDSNGILHYHLHQCRSDGGGTVSGRYSSSAVNIQQVPSVDNQEEITRRWIVRELFLPAHGRTWCSADASQIEFRVFSHYANAEKLIQAYNSDSTTDFHKFVAEITGLDRKPAKNVNFMALYGGGRTKFMYMMKLAGQPVTEEQTEEFYEKYNSAFPEARKLLRKASDLAKRRGYVRTILGRRARFPEKQRLHSALNRIIQGSAADIMKSKLIQVYNHCRGYFDLRFTVHDEVDGDVDSPKDAERLSEVLNGFTPQIDVRVPIRWEVKTGKNWRLQ